MRNWPYFRTPWGSMTWRGGRVKISVGKGLGGWGGAGFFNGSSFTTVSRCAKGDSASFSQLRHSKPHPIHCYCTYVQVAYLHIKKIRKKLKQNLNFNLTWSWLTGFSLFFKWPKTKQLPRGLNPDQIFAIFEATIELSRHRTDAFKLELLS
jgi:hypothetical protein